MVVFGPGGGGGGFLFWAKHGSWVFVWSFMHFLVTSCSFVFVIYVFPFSHECLRAWLGCVFRYAWAFF